MQNTEDHYQAARCSKNDKTEMLHKRVFFAFAVEESAAKARAKRRPGVVYDFGRVCLSVCL